MQLRLSYLVGRNSLSIVLVFILFTVSGFAMPGDLDTTFGMSGVAMTPFSPHGPQPGNDIIVQPDGKIVVASGALADFLQSGWNIARYNPDGTLDSTFATGGKMTFSLNSRPTQCNSVALQPDGKIIVAGTHSFITGPPDQTLTNPRITRLTANGAVEGIFEIPLSLNVNFRINDVAVQSDGKILIVGNLFTNAYLIRFNSSGTVDTTFDGDGIVNFGATAVNAVSAQADGKALVAGQSGNDWAVWRFNTNGAPDTSFDFDGVFTGPAGTSDSSVAREMVIRPNGKILTTGNATVGTAGTAGTALVQLNTDGSLDTSFSGDGKVFTAIPNTAGGLDVELQPDGRAVAFSGSPVSTSGSNGGTTFGLSRYLSNGELDNSFSGDGINSVSIVANPSAIALQPDGKIVASGSTMTGGFGNSFGVARFTGGGAKDFDFDGDGRADIGIFRPTGPSGWEWWIQRSTAGLFATPFGSGSVNSDTRLTPADYTGDGKADIAFYQSGAWFVLRSENQTFYGAPFGASSGDLARPGDYDGDGKADLAVFRPSNGVWYIQQSSNNATLFVPFGLSGDAPMPRDYDGDAITDIAITRINAGGGNSREWWVRRSSDGGVFAYAFGTGGDVAVPGDYTGDGKADIAFWRPTDGNWFILRSEDLGYHAFAFGNGSFNDKVAPGDYDGDGMVDAAVFRPAGGQWYIRRSSDSGATAQNFGVATDQPIPGTYAQ
jgi:uncharacterized delta-60 repeat protein